MSEVHLKIDNIDVTANEGDTILDAAIAAGIHIPTLCYLKDVNKSGACRVCLVEVKRARNLLSACTTPVAEGQEVFTHTKRVLDARRNTVELILSNHSKDCLSCVRNQNCELQTLTEELGIRDVPYSGEKKRKTIDDFVIAIERDASKCVLCGRCVETCKKFQGLGILGYEQRGFETVVAPIYGKAFAEVNCMQCGQCVINCPTAALSVKEDTQKVIEALNDPEKFVVVQTAPAVRAALGEEFGLPIGTRVTGKMAAALKQCGFDRVYDTNFGADLTIMEEGYEFMDRLQNGGVLPMITSCSPGWVRYAEFEYGDILDHLSTCKSPHMMLGAMIKRHFAEVNKIDPSKIVNVSIMPCSAKKAEIIKPELLEKDGLNDVDIVLTTRECAHLIKAFGIDFVNLKDEQFDQDLFGEYTGAGVIFGATGGVMEAALRTVADVLEKKDLPKVDYEAVRGLEGVKEATLNIAGMEVKIAVTSGMANAKLLLDQIRNGTSPYHFIEIMGCPGGCINGGGQPFVSSVIKNKEGLDAYRQKRAKALYDEDKIMPLRKSHENSQIQALYRDYLGKPGGELSHHYLHTTYSQKPRFK
ncbi:MAG: NADH-dependent [FeFe] hydrogenase, group A6 [Erysipelotrichaceae bacterium]|nr:NADH-dependent [FeFe] hydrogenase, group A6 [Erysipelotrichaceae bacterium]